MSTSRQYFVLILLCHCLLGFHGRSIDNRRFHPLLKHRSAENDNEYVWFTRSIHPAMINEHDQVKIPTPLYFDGTFFDRHDFQRSEASEQLD
jgi:hypothetical protein